MASAKEGLGITVFAILSLLGSAIYLIVVGLRGDFPAIFGFSNGWAVVPAVQVAAAVSLWVNKPTLHLSPFD